jgi:hypothetical protein
MDKEAVLQSVVLIMRFIKTLRVQGVWRDDTWHFLMTALDERVQGLSEVDICAIAEYRAVLEVAIMYLKDHPDQRKRKELQIRTTEETIMLRKALPRMRFTRDEWRFLERTMEGIDECRKKL